MVNLELSASIELNDIAGWPRGIHFFTLDWIELNPTHTTSKKGRCTFTSLIFLFLFIYVFIMLWLFLKISIYATTGKKKKTK